MITNITIRDVLDLPGVRVEFTSKVKFQVAILALDFTTVGMLVLLMTFEMGKNFEPGAAVFFSTHKQPLLALLVCFQMLAQLVFSLESLLADFADVSASVSLVMDSIFANRRKFLLAHKAGR